MSNSDFPNAQNQAAGAIPVYTVSNPAGLPIGIFTGQQTATGSAAALANQALANNLVVTALSTNTGTVYVGASGVTTGTGYPLAPGQSIGFVVPNADAVYIVGSGTVAWAGN